MFVCTRAKKWPCTSELIIINILCWVELEIVTCAHKTVKNILRSNEP